MAHEVFCQKLGERLPGLSFAPLKGPLGQKIYQHISLRAWDQWLEHSMKLINEYRLDLSEAKNQEFLKQELEKFLFAHS